MRITRVHTPDLLSVGMSVLLHPMSSAHLVKVLRLRAGARVILFNGDGSDYLSELVVPKAEAAQVQVLSKQAACAESPLAITLLQGICRGDKMDWVLEKATELGVKHIIPVHSERSEVHLDAERAAKRREHWQRVVMSACEQSGRAVLPSVAPLQPLDQHLSLSPPAAGKFVLEPGAQKISRIAHGFSELQLAVGPEGGWSERDLAQFALAGFQPISLGPRVMRTETAGPAGIAAMQALFGDFA
jgi:16S rRNA (uracil1498-N3)-methyltransferase